jgi:D-inositol-3-phosphate glycosyltransferase
MFKSNKLKIAILSVHSSPLGRPGIGDTGGMSIYIRELTQELARQGHAVDIFTRVKDPVTPEIIELAPNARQIHIPDGGPGDIDKLLIYNNAPDFACKTATFCKQNELSYDLIFSHYWISGIAGQYLQAWWQVPLVSMFHTLGAIKNALGTGEDESDLRIEEERQVAASSSRIIASTEAEKIALYRFYGVPAEKISVIPCGVNLDLFKISEKRAARQRIGITDGKIILFVGRIERLKGIDRLVQTLPFLQDIKPTLVIVGEDGNRPGETDNLRKLADNLGVANSVFLPGLQDYEKLPDFYNAADVCAFPSYYESFGLVPLESLACGTPVVATDVGDLKHIIRDGETGFVIPNNQPQLLAAKLRAVLDGTNQNLLDRQAIRFSVTRYGWDKIAHAVTGVITELINESLKVKS